MDKAASSEKYYFQVVKTGETPTWPRPVGDLVIGQKEIPGDLTQFWAYPKDLAKESDDIPPAEVLASENPAPKAAILVDQPRAPLSEDDACLELILVRDGHALARTSSSVSDLEENISAILNDGQKKFTLTVEHFMTTDRVSEDVEKKLDSLEEGAEKPPVASEPETSTKEEAPITAPGTTPEPKTVESEPVSSPSPLETPEVVAAPAPSPVPPPIDFNSLSNPSKEPEESATPIIRPVQSQIPSSGIYSSTRSSRPASDLVGKLKWVVIILVILGILAAGFAFRDKILSKVSFFGGGQPASDSEVTPTPVPSVEPTPTPTPSVERSEFTVRVLNGTDRTGAASALGDELKNLGWKIDRVGNNSDQEVKKGYVRSKEDTDKSALDVLLLDLGESYEATSSALEDNDKADLEVVIGPE